MLKLAVDPERPEACSPRQPELGKRPSEQALSADVPHKQTTGTAPRQSPPRIPPPPAHGIAGACAPGAVPPGLRGDAPAPPQRVQCAGAGSARARVMSLCTAPAQEKSRNDGVAMESREGEAPPERPAGEGRRERRARVGGRGGVWRGSRANPRRARTQMPDPVGAIKIIGEEKGGLPAGQAMDPWAPLPIIPTIPPISFPLYSRGN